MSAQRKTKPSILKYFSGVPREVQRQTLLEIEANWDSTDVFVISAPTGSGKSKIAMCIADWQFSVDVITPTNLLVQQYAKDNPKFPKLLRQDLYPCCKAHTFRGRVHRHLNCERTSDLRRVYGMKRGLMNYYMYMSLKSRSRPRTPGSVLIVDEAHNLIGTLQSLMSKKIWRHDYMWPDSIETGEDLGNWARERRFKDPHNKTYKFIEEQAFSDKPVYVFERTSELWRKTKEPEYRDVINIKPIEVSNGPPHYWGPHINKLILMSATISRKDIETMGLHRRRVKYLDCNSPIPVKNRPVIFEPVTPITRGQMDLATKKVATQINCDYLPRHVGEKGVIHCTYDMAERLRQYLRSDRFIFHDKYNKSSQFQKFVDSPTSEGKVLVASGLYEGIDLPGDLGRWQVLAKVPWPSLQDRAILYKSEHDPGWYAWQTLKDLIQATGRVSRGATDYGITYILDSTFQKLYDNHIDLFPAWFLDALKMEKKDENSTI